MPGEVTSVRIDPELKKLAKENNLNMSRLLEEAIMVSIGITQDLEEDILERRQKKAMFDKKKAESSLENIEKFREELEGKTRKQKIDRIRNIIRNNAYEPELAWQEVCNQGLDEIDYT